MKLIEYDHQGVCCKEYSIETHASSNTLDISKNGQTIPNIRKNHVTFKKKLQRMGHILNVFFHDLFLPIGYPKTVRPEYLQYQLYDSLQGLCSYLRGIVSTSAVLQAAGVGNANATALSAAITWVIKDGIGLIGSLIFSYTCSFYFDSYVKEFRLLADVLNDFGLSLDMIAPFFGSSYFLIISSCSTLCKIMCGIAAGATKSSITIYLATHGNVADLNAKESTQETFVSLLGMIGGLLIAKHLQATDNDEHGTDKNNTGLSTFAWIYFIFLTIVHVWANYKGVDLLRLNTLNEERLEQVLSVTIKKNILNTIHEKVLDSTTSHCNDCTIHDTFTESITSIKSPKQTHESILSSYRKLLGIHRNIYLGVRLSTILSSSSFQKHKVKNHALITWILKEEFINEKYFLWIQNTKVYICLRFGSNWKDELKAFVHAYFISRYFQYNNTFVESQDQLKKLIKLTHQTIIYLFHDIKGLHNNNSFTTDNQNSYKKISLIDALTKRGWDCSRIYLSYGLYRVSWGDHIIPIQTTSKYNAVANDKKII